MADTGITQDAAGAGWTAGTLYFADADEAWQRLRDLHLRSLGGEQDLATDGVEELTPEAAFTDYSNACVATLAQFTIATEDHVAELTRSLCEFAVESGSVEGLESLLLTGLDRASDQLLSGGADWTAQLGELGGLDLPAQLACGVDRTPIFDSASGQVAFAALEDVNGLLESLAGSASGIDSIGPNMDSFKAGFSGLFESQPAFDDGTGMLSADSGGAPSGGGAAPTSFVQDAKDYAEVGKNLGQFVGAIVGMSAVASFAVPAIPTAEGAVIAGSAATGPAAPAAAAAGTLAVGAVAVGAILAGGAAGGTLGGYAGSAAGVTVAAISHGAGWVSEHVGGHHGTGGPAGGGVVADTGGSHGTSTTPAPSSGTPAPSAPTDAGHAGERKTLKPGEQPHHLPSGEGGEGDGEVDGPGGGLFGVPAPIPHAGELEAFGQMISKDVLQLVTIPAFDEGGELTAEGAYANLLLDLANMSDNALTIVDRRATTESLGEGSSSADVAAPEMAVSSDTRTTYDPYAAVAGDSPLLRITRYGEVVVSG